MKTFLKRVATKRFRFPFAVSMLLGVVIAVGLWLGVDPRKFESATPTDASEDVQKIENPQAGENWERN